MKMLPNQVKIKKNVIYEKVYQDLIGNDVKTIGYCDSATKHLYIKLGLSKLLEKDTEAHELLHAICDEYKIKINHSELDKLATALVRVFMLNKWIK